MEASHREKLIAIVASGNTDQARALCDALGVPFDLSGADLHGAVLRKSDFQRANLEGASLMDAKVSGVYFPAELSADEIRLSLDHGTRLRYTQN